MTLNICYVTNEFPAWGGYGAYVEGLVRELALKRHNIHVITAKSIYSHNESFSDNVIIHKATRSKLLMISTMEFELNINRKLRELYNEFAFDIVHQNSPICPQLPIATNAPQIVTSHGCIRSLEHYLLRYNSQKHLTEKIMCLGSKVFSKLEEKSLQSADAIIAVSNWTKKELETRYKLPDDKIIVIYNGVDPRVFQPMKDARRKIVEKMKIEFDDDQKLVLFVGRFYGVKDPLTLIKAIPRVVREYKDVTFFFVGRNERSQKMLGNYLKKSKAPVGCYKFMGHVHHYLLPMLYSSADVYVLTSIYENCSTTILEAMSCQRPVIASDVGGIPEIIHDHKNGFLFKPQDHIELSDLLLQVLDDGKMANRVALNARKTVLEKFDWKVISNEVEDLYNKICTRGS